MNSGSNTSMRMGIYGGAFDPPHLAHVELAEVAIGQFKLDQLLVIPTGDAIHKRRHLTASHHRLEMTRLAFKGLFKTVVDPREINRGGASYTIDTLLELKAENPNTEFTLIIGQDQLTAFHTWRNYSDILALAGLAVALRGDSIMISPDIPFTPLEFAPRAVSSSDVRQLIRMRYPEFSSKMSPSVAAYITEHQLFLH